MTADTPGTLDTGQKMEGFKFHPSFLLSKHKTEKMDIKKTTIPKFRIYEGFSITLILELQNMIEVYINQVRGTN